MLLQMLVVCKHIMSLLRDPPNGGIIELMHDFSESRTTWRPRVLLVGLTETMLTLLEGELAAHAEVSCVPFPSQSFDATVADIQPHLVVVDVTYLDEGRVRPMMMERFADSRAALVFANDSGYAWVDDLAQGRSDYLPDASPDTLLGVIARPHLEVVST